MFEKEEATQAVLTLLMETNLKVRQIATLSALGGGRLGEGPVEAERPTPPGNITPSPCPLLSFFCLPFPFFLSYFLFLFSFEGA